ncbi:MAG: gamma-glutamylcyclotransferase family protein, partial [Chloroflexota bacterium]
MSLTYFAYGSNMSPESIKATCPVAEPIGPARLDHHRLAFTRHSPKWGGGVADIVSAPGMVVWGVLYRIEPKCQVALDLREGNGVAYIRSDVSVQTPTSGRIRAITYKVIRPVYPEIPPTDRYLHAITTGARNHNLPADYQHFLTTLWDNRYNAAYRTGLLVVSNPNGNRVYTHPDDAASGPHMIGIGDQHYTADVVNNPQVPKGTCWLGQDLRAALDLPETLYGTTITLQPAP